MTITEFMHDHGLTILRIRDNDEGQQGISLTCEGDMTSPLGSRHGIDGFHATKMNGLTYICITPEMCRKIAAL